MGQNLLKKTDHKPLKQIFSTEMKKRKIQMRGITISEYNCKIEYLEGKKNIRADMLSRPPGAETDDTERIDKNINVINYSKLAAEETDNCQ